MNKRITIIGFLLLTISLSICAQVAMGKWRTHFAYNNVSKIAQSDNKIYAISEGALFSVDKQDGGMEFYSKLSGLNGSNISQIKFDTANKSLLIIYSNGNIDILSASGVTNIPDLYNKQMSSSKDVNHIQFYQSKAYLSCNFGIVVLNMDKKEVADTYIIGPNATEIKVLNTTINKGFIYALTSVGDDVKTPLIYRTYKASVSETHLVNYEFWSQVNNLPGSGNFQSFTSFSNKLILLRSGKLYKQENDNSWTPILNDITATNINVSSNNLNIFTSNSVLISDSLFNIKTVSLTGNFTDAEFDSQNNTFYFAANSLGIVSYKQISNETPVISYFKPVGPAVNSPWDMTFSGKKLFVVPGGRWSSQNNTDGNVMMYENGVWTNILRNTIQNQTGNDVEDFMNVAVDPADNTHFFVTSYGTGLYEFKNNIYTNWYNQLNSSLETIYPNNQKDQFNYIRLDGAVFDKQGNLFMTNSQVSKGIKIRLSNGTWTQLDYPTTNNKLTLGKILISNQNQNQKWIVSVRVSKQIGLCVFDDNGTITDQSDDKSTLIFPFTYPDLDNTGHTITTSVSPSAIFTLAQDKNGVIWVGTDIGPFLFNNLSNVFNSDYTCSRVKIPRNDNSGLADYLLVGEEIKAIAIDGANRKWLGTKSSGVYLMSENGQQTIQHFTTSNSPLLSNNILSIAINPVTGEVFFGTDQGLVSYQSDASEAGSTFGEVYAYPNPVRQGYTGVITITGLVENTQVKITDISGNLVCETVSNGSLATWNGKDVHGRKVSTGVYLAICVNPDGTQSTITKILVIN